MGHLALCASGDVVQFLVHFGDQQGVVMLNCLIVFLVVYIVLQNMFLAGCAAVVYAVIFESTKERDDG